MSLRDKALTAWTSVAVPASTAGIPVTWEMFKQTKLTNFAHPDRQHQALEQLHKIRQRTVGHRLRAHIQFPCATSRPTCPVNYRPNPVLSLWPIFLFQRKMCHQPYHWHVLD